MAILIAKAGDGKKWNTASSWEEEGTKTEKTPTGSDDCILNETSGSIEIATSGSSSVCRSLDCQPATGGEYKKTLTMAANRELSIGTINSNEAHRVLRLSTAMTLAGTGTFKLKGSASNEESVTWAGKEPATVAFESAANTGKWILQDELKASKEVKVTRGSVNLGSNKVVTPILTVFASEAPPWTIGFTGTGIIRITGKSGKVLEISANGTFTVSLGEATIEFVGTGEEAKEAEIANNATVKAGNTVPNIVIETDNFKGIFGSTSEYPSIKLNTGGNAHYTQLGSFALKTTGTFTTNAKSGAIAKIKGTVEGAKFVVKKTVGEVSLDYVELKDSEGTGGAEFLLGPHSTSLGGLTNWKLMKEILLTQAQSVSPIKFLSRTPTAVTQSVVLSVRRLQERLFSTTQASVISTQKSLPRSSVVVQSQEVELGRLAGRSFKVTQSGEIEFSKLSNRFAKVTQGTTLSLGRAGHIGIATTQASTVSIARKTSLSQTFELIQPVAVENIKRVITLAKKLTQAQTLIFEKTAPKGFVFEVTQAATATFEKAQKRQNVVTQAVTLSVGRALTKTVTVPAEVIAVANRLLTRLPFKLEQTQVAKIGIGRIFPKFTVTQSSTAKITTTPGRTFSVAQPQSVIAPARALVRIILAPSTSKAVISERAITKSIKLTQPQTLTFFKSFIRPVLITTKATTAISVMRSPQKSFAIAAPQAITRAKGLAHEASLTVPTLLKLQRASNRTVSLIQISSVTREKALAKNLILTQPVTVKALRGLLRVFSLVAEITLNPIKTIQTGFALGQGQAATESQRAQRTMLLPAGSSPSLGRSVARSFAIAQPQSATRIFTHIFHRLFSVTQGSAVTSQKLPNKVLLATQPQSATYSRALFKVVKIIAPITPIANRLLERLPFEVKQFTVLTFLKSRVYSMTFETVATTAIKLNRGFRKRFVTEQPQVLSNTYRFERLVISSGTITWVLGVDKIVSGPAIMFEDGGSKVITNLRQFQAVITPGSPDTLVFKLQEPKNLHPGATTEKRWQ